MEDWLSRDQIQQQGHRKEMPKQQFLNNNLLEKQDPWNDQ